MVLLVVIKCQTFTFVDIEIFVDDIESLPHACSGELVLVHAVIE